MLATRARMQTGQKIRESSWYVAGPLKAKSFSEVHFPERGVDLEARDQQTPRWKARSYPNGKVNALRAGDRTATYFYRTVSTATPQPLRIGLGSDDGIEFWFNGEKLVSKDVARGSAPDQDVVTVNLKAGTNTLLLKIFNQTGDSSFYYNNDQSSPGALEVVARQFPNEAKIFARYASSDKWFEQPGSTQVEQTAIQNLLKRLPGAVTERQNFESLKEAKAGPENPEWLRLTLSLGRQADTFARAVEEVKAVNLTSLRLAVEDLCTNFPGKYTGGESYLRAIKEFEQQLARDQIEPGERRCSRPREMEPVPGTPARGATGQSPVGIPGAAGSSPQRKRSGAACQLARQLEYQPAGGKRDCHHADTRQSPRPADPLQAP